MSNQIEVHLIGGTAEVAALLKCQKQQIHALRKRLDFPKPIIMLSATPIWNLDDVRRFEETWVRRKAA